MKILYSKTIPVLIFISAAISARAQQNDNPLNVLIKKNLVTQQEADSIRAGRALKQQHTLDKAKENQRDITIGSRALQISGLVQARYQGFEQSTSNNAFDLHRARLDAKGNITDQWGYEIYTEFASSVKLLDAYTACKVTDYLKLQAGQFKIPFSYESLTPDSKLEFIERSQAVEALAGRSKDVIGDQNGRDIGIQIDGNFAKVTDLYLLDYAFGVFNGAGYGVTTDNNNHKDIVARLGLHPIKGLDFGYSLYQGEDIPAATTKAPNPVTQARNRYGFDGRYVTGPLSITAEYVNGTDASIHREGWYAQAGYFVIPKKLQLVAKYDTYDPNKVITTDCSTIYTGGVNYIFNKWTRLAVDYLDVREQTTQIKNNKLEVQMQIAF